MKNISKVIILSALIMILVLGANAISNDYVGSVVGAIIFVIIGGIIAELSGLLALLGSKILKNFSKLLKKNQPPKKPHHS